MRGGGDWGKPCISEGRGFGDVLLGGFPPLLKVSRAYMHVRESPRDEGFRGVVDLITALPDPWRNNVCVVEGVVEVLPSSPPFDTPPPPDL
jgi:hypothetical protein